MKLFNYKNFIMSLRNNHDFSKRETYKMKTYLSKSFNIKKEPFYNYLQKFKPIKYRVPKKLEEYFDWNFLLQIIVSSRTIDYSFEFPEFENNYHGELEEYLEFEMLLNMINDDDNEFSVYSDKKLVKNNNVIPELNIIIKTHDVFFESKISMMNEFQILGLFEALLSELINFQYLELEDSTISNDKIVIIKTYQKFYYKAEKIIQRWEVLNKKY